MKKILVILGFLVLLPSVCFGELYVIVDKSTKEIFSVSGKDDTLIPDGKELKVLPGDMASYKFITNPTEMLLTDKNEFVVNTKKQNDRYQAEVIAKEKVDEEKLVNDKMRQMAIDELKKSGTVFKHL